MKADYFYGEQAEQFSFYRIPKALFTQERFKCISTEAKILYGILLDRMSLSKRNGWLDEDGRVFIVFTLDEIKESMGCADQKAVKLLAELDDKADLIERRRQGLGRPNIIYVKNFVAGATDNGSKLPESQHKNCENHNSGALKITDQELPKSHSNKTDKSKTEISETDIYPILSEQITNHGRETTDRMGSDAIERQRFRFILEENLELDTLLENNPTDRDTIREIVELMLDTICSKRKIIRVAKDDKPHEVVKDQFLKIHAEHIEYVLKSMHESPGRIRNIKQYLLTALYNAPLTMSSYFDALVRSDMADGVI